MRLVRNRAHLEYKGAVSEDDVRRALFHAAHVCLSGGRWEREEGHAESRSQAAFCTIAISRHGSHGRFASRYSQAPFTFGSPRLARTGCAPRSPARNRYRTIPISARSTHSRLLFAPTLTLTLSQPTPTRCRAPYPAQVRSQRLHG